MGRGYLVGGTWEGRGGGKWEGVYSSVRSIFSFVFKSAQRINLRIILLYMGWGTWEECMGIRGSSYVVPGVSVVGEAEG